MSTASLIFDGNEKPIGIICRGPAMEEKTRRPNGAPRWCFHCRSTRDFVFTVTAPTEPSYYEPISAIRCAHCNTTDGDCFPGRYREWE